MHEPPINLVPENVPGLLRHPIASDLPVLVHGKHVLDNGGRSQFGHRYEDLISVENLLLAWKEFVRGKRGKKDVQDFQYHLMDNVLKLHTELSEQTYRHGPYHAFKIADPKPRDIHKALVRDRLLHHAIYRQLYPFFDRTFISDSYSCRNNKGTHKAMDRFREFASIVSKNNTRTCWVLKCDVRKFFASIDQGILLKIVADYIPDTRIVGLLENIVRSFHSTSPGKGLPLGNLTSQLLVNIYMNEFDQFAKHRIKATHYIRYADDFVFLSEDRKHLENVLPKVHEFLDERLALRLHPDKVYIQTFASGVDFLGWVHFPTHRVFRASSRKRMVRNLGQERSEARIQSYKGILGHGNGHKLSTRYLGDSKES